LEAVILSYVFLVRGSCFWRLGVYWCSRIYWRHGSP